ncbi:hypothetical protein BJY01DRAFT_252950 [Aspergillus pseudoustus]|uniref:Uncharacterized protein n=1 Tax=Aspergillus pseudoustus TaxID=1810923 RepID=A0ABR4J6K1_9EURO
MDDKVPFTKQSELIGQPRVGAGLDGSPPLNENPPALEDMVPNEPFLRNADTSEVAKFLQREVVCVTMEEMYGYLAFVGRKSGDHIDPLHVHLLKGRTRKNVEDPGLHLVWYYNDLYIKPLPHCLLNFCFWRTHSVALPPQTPEQASLYAAAIGFVRSYAFLIHHKSDFYIAQKKHIVPEKVSYSEFQRYIHPFSKIHNNQVTPRWKFGQLRLTRLNWAIRLAQPESRKGKGFLQGMFYLQVYWQTGQFLSELVAPILFIYASLSLSLSAMSLIHATRSPRWTAVENGL